MGRAQRRSSDGLSALLERARQDSVEFPLLLANHAPMALIGLDRLGASCERLAQYGETYRATNGLVPVPPPVAPLEPRTWTEAIGQRCREADARAYFASEIARRGITDVMAATLPKLLPGIGASALHAFMRLAYGMMRQDAEEAGVALAYWTVTYLPMPLAAGGPATADPAEVLAEVAAMPALRGIVPESDLLWHNIKAVGSVPAFGPVIDMLRVDRSTLGKVASTALALYAATMDFAALHALTGAHWVRLLAPHCADPPALIRHFWQVVAALVPKLGFPTLPDEVTLARWRQAPCPDWPAIRAAAIASEDEHDISLVFSADEEGRHYGDRLYQVVAARRLGLIE